MNCKKIKKFLLTDYIDGRLDAGAVAELEKHIENCPECKRLYGSLNETSLLLKKARRIQVPEYLSALVDKKIADHERKEKARKINSAILRRIMIPVYSFAAAALLFVGVYNFSSKKVNTEDISLNESQTIEDVTNIYQYADKDENNGDGTFGFGSAVEEIFL